MQVAINLESASESRVSRERAVKAVENVQLNSLTTLILRLFVCTRGLYRSAGHERYCTSVRPAAVRLTN
eukprot:7205277-Prymnesium_polylepis.1